MVSFKFLSLISVFAVMGGVFSVPVDTTLSVRATPAAPHFVIYSDKWVSGENGPPPVSDVTVRFPDDGLSSYLLILLSFNKGYNVL